MAVILSPTSSIPDVRAYLHTIDEVDAIKKGLDLGEDCGICFTNCDIPIPQFIDTGDTTNSYSNDYFSFILEGFTGGSIEATFENLSTGQTQTLTNDDYGTLNNMGDFLPRPRVWGFITDWHAIHATYGYGIYKFTFARKNGNGDTLTTSESPCFHLQPWDCEMASNTFRIETRHYGKRPRIEGGFDYTDISPVVIINGLPASGSRGWRQQLRWYGKFVKTTPELIDERVELTDRGQDQVQTQIIDKYTLRMDYIRAEVSDQVIYDNILANEVFITDYNVGNPDELIEKRVIPIEIAEMEAKPFDKHRQILINFAQYKQDILKRNY